MTLRVATEGKTVSKQGRFVSIMTLSRGGGGSELNITMTLIFSSNSLDVPPKRLAIVVGITGCTGNFPPEFVLILNSRSITSIRALI